MIKLPIEIPEIKYLKLNIKSLYCLSAALIIYGIAPSYATDQVIDIIPPTISTASTTMQGEETHPILRLTPDKSELIRLDKDAVSIIIGSPDHINVIADTPRTLVVVPRAAGATHFTILDKNGQIIMQRHVIVASPKEGYIKIKRTCSGEDENCQNTSVFYCPDMCHEIGMSNKDKESANNEASNHSSNSNSGNSNSGNSSSGASNTRDINQFEGNE